MVLIGYDGSEDAKRAIEAAAELFADDAVVLCASTPAVAERAEADEADEESAHVIAEEGADLARALGLDAEAMVEVGGGVSTVANTISEVAERRRARAIVVGRRGRSKLQSVVLGSVSSALVEHASLPVLVCPPPD